MALNKNDLLALVATTITTNGNEEVTAADFRAIMEQMIDSDLNLLEPGESPYIANRVIVNQASDFPAESGGVITLAADTQYYIAGNITVLFPFVLGVNTSFGGRPSVSRITYAGAGVLFTGIDAGNFDLGYVGIDCPNADILDIQNVALVNQTFVNMKDIFIFAAQSFGSFKDILGFGMESIVVYSIGSGLTDAGTVTSFLTVEKMGYFSTNPSFIGFDLGSNSYTSLEISNVRFTAPAGGIGISGLANNANINVNEISTIQSNEFTGGCTPLSGILETDHRYDFVGNGQIPNSEQSALISLESNATATTISAINTPVKVAGTWVADAASQSQFLSDTTGKATALFERNIKIPITISLSLEPSAGTNIDLSAYIAVNGVVTSPPVVKVRADANNPFGATIVWKEIMTKDDYIELYVENNSNTTNVLVRNAVIRNG